ncbi:MAG TPA: GNAT family protein [Chthoniobacteraceae bacterium]|jgi:RimJ/RimL family protein N-acetyltransferase|nr:GNAT family protein [Chthoniobacteraceae bacterium]
MSPLVPIAFAEVDPEHAGGDVAAFLSQHSWPFHARSTLTLEEARQIKLGPSDQVRAYWIRERTCNVGLVRIFDLQDVERGSALFDLRVANQCRGRGIGRATVSWLVDMLFSEYPALHRIEATTRIDNLAMRRVLEFNGFVLEGRLRETWPSDDGIRHDTALYGRLRSDSAESC